MRVGWFKWDSVWNVNVCAKHKNSDMYLKWWNWFISLIDMSDMEFDGCTIYYITYVLKAGEKPRL